MHGTAGTTSQSNGASKDGAEGSAW